MREYYDNDNKKLCHAVKEGDPEAILRMAREIAESEFIPSNAILIPAPDHTGRATYTLKLAEEIAVLKSVAVCDALECKPHESLYDAKYNNHEIDLEFNLIDNIPPDRPLYFVDNVISSGQTFAAAREVIGNALQPLAYAIDLSRLDEKYHVFDNIERTQIMITCNRKDFERLPVEFKEHYGEISEVDYEFAAFRYPDEEDNVPLDLCLNIPSRMYSKEELDILCKIMHMSMELGEFWVDGVMHGYRRLSSMEIDDKEHLFPSEQYMHETASNINSALGKSGINVGIAVSDLEDPAKRHFEFYLESPNGMEMLSLAPNQCTLSTIIHTVAKKVEEFEKDRSSENPSAWRQVLSELEYLDSKRNQEIKAMLSDLHAKRKERYAETVDVHAMEDEPEYRLTDIGIEKVKAYIKELEAKRKEILDAGKDTAEDTNLPTIADIESDIFQFIGMDGIEGEYCNGWGVTDNYNCDYPLCLHIGEDFIKAREIENNEIEDGYTMEDESKFPDIDKEAKRMAENGNNKEYRLRDNLWAVALGTKSKSDKDIDMQEIHCHIEHLVNEIMQNEMKDNPIVKNKIHIDGVDVNIQGFDDMTVKEVRNYIALSKIQKCSPGETLTEIDILKGKDDKVSLSYNIKSLPFERIRRITGYLVGSIDRWNNAKRAEEHDRVKHTLGR